MKMEKLRKIIESQNWDFNAEESSDGSYIFTLFDFGKFGKDLTTEFTLAKYSVINFLNALDCFIENYDVDYETYLWLDNMGHGTRGAPYCIRDILEENEEYLSRLEKLSDCIHIYM